MPRKLPAYKLKINAVALKGDQRGRDRRPAHLGARAGHGSHGNRSDAAGRYRRARLHQYMPLSMVRADLAERYTLEDIDYRTGGPARYMRVKETGGQARLHHADDP